MASYYPGSGYPVAATVKGKKHTLLLDGDDWYVEVKEYNSTFMFVVDNKNDIWI